MKENNKVIVSNTLLVNAGKSSRLAAIRKKVQQASTTINNQSRQFASELKVENKAILQQAISLVEQSIAEILKSYPAGKKHTFFKLKYGIKVDEISKVSIKQVFQLLHLNTASIHNFRFIEHLDFTGKIAGK